MYLPKMSGDLFAWICRRPLNNHSYHGKPGFLINEGKPEVALNAKDNITKVVTDFIKGKTGPPDMEIAELLIKGEIPPDMFMPTKISSTYGEFESEYSTVVSSLSKCSLEHCLAILGSMFTLPEIRSNAYRLEVLVHLAFLNAKGKARPTPAQIVAWFKQLDNGTCGEKEDPAEDVFVSRVTTNSGDYRLFEGRVEGNNFHTQLFLSILENMPDNNSYRSLKNTVKSLLKLSDEIVERSGVPVHCIGNTTVESKIGTPSKQLWLELRRRVVFTFDELEQIGIDSSSLEPFLTGASDVQNLRAYSPGSSPLDFNIIHPTSSGLIVFQPGLIGTAIRYLLITNCIASGMRESLHKELGNAYAVHFENERFLDFPPPIFEYYDGFCSYSTVKEIDHGRYLHLLFFVDGFKDFEKGGFLGFNPVKEISEYVRKSIEHEQKNYSSKKEFREGLTLVVGCDWGRHFALEPIKNTEEWRTIMISPYDITTLNHVASFQSLDFLRVLDAEEALRRLNVELRNVNGFLNLFAWMKHNNGHIIPHEKMGKNLPSFLSIPPNSNLNLRRDTCLATDIRTLRRPDGSIAKLRKMYGASRLNAKDSLPFYVDVEALKDCVLRVVYIGKHGIYWTEVKTSPELGGEMRYQLSDMIGVWSELVFKHFDERECINDNIRVSCCFHFSNQKIPHGSDAKPSDKEISMLVERSHQDDNGTIVFNVKESFLSASRHPKNVAERVIVRAIIESCFEALAETPGNDEVNSFINAVVEKDTARQFHAFLETRPHDFIRDDLPEEVQIIEQMDDANARLGLGWLCRNPSEGGEIKGLEECRNYLKKLCIELIKNYKTNIARFNKRFLVEYLLRNHETSLYEAEHWRRTYGAIASLRGEAAAISDAHHKIGLYNAASISSRIAIEAAICECPLDGGLKPGNYDVAQLLVYASMIHNMGQFSVIMNAGMMEHIIKISPAGEVMINHDFSDEIIRPYGESIQTKLLKDAAQKYSENYNPEVNQTESGAEEKSLNFSPQFEQAWYEEYGFSLDNLRTFLGKIWTLLEKHRKAVLQMKRSELISMLCSESDISPEIATACIQAFSSIPRDKWDESPEGYRSSAWHPWRFRRQLSLISRPIIQLANTDDPDCLISPAMIVHFIINFVSDAVQGALSTQVFQENTPMYDWIDTAARTQGEEFNEKVAVKFESAGWIAQANLSDGEILGRPKKRTFGDVDVLAWDEKQKMVLIIECKDLLFDKTPGEIANRLAKFRGVRKSDGKRDELKKHLDRCEEIRANPAQLSKFVGFDVEHIEGVLIFGKPTPVQFSNIVKDFSTVYRFDEIEKIFGKK